MNAIDRLRKQLEGELAEARLEVDRLESLLAAVQQVEDEMRLYDVKVDTKDGVLLCDHKTAENRRRDAQVTYRKRLQPNARDAIVAAGKKGTFTKYVIAEACGREHRWAHTQLVAAELMGIVRPTAPIKQGTETVWEYVVPQAQKAAAKKAEERRGSQPVAGTGKRQVSGRKDVKKLVKQIKEAGGTVELRGSGHVLVTGPNGTAMLASTPGEGRGDANAKADLKRAGL